MKRITELSRGNLYNTIQTHPLSLSERDVVQALDRSRIDPRLMEVITEFLRDFWWLQNPALLNKSSKKAKYPFMITAAVSVILDYCKMSETNRNSFLKWVQLALRGIKDPPPQLLYIGVLPVGSKLIQRELEEALPSLFKHGLIAKDLPFNKGIPGELKSATHLPKNRVDDVDLLKLKYAQMIKELKLKRGLSNSEIIKKTGINRVFLSRILNNKLENISVEYLSEKARKIA